VPQGGVRARLRDRVLEGEEESAAKLVGLAQPLAALAAAGCRLLQQPEPQHEGHLRRLGRPARQPRGQGEGASAAAAREARRARAHAPSCPSRTLPAATRAQAHLQRDRAGPAEGGQHGICVGRRPEKDAARPQQRAHLPNQLPSDRRVHTTHACKPAQCSPAGAAQTRLPPSQRRTGRKTWQRWRRHRRRRRRAPPPARALRRSRAPAC
jgi:hypothetical protein